MIADDRNRVREADGWLWQSAAVPQLFDSEGRSPGLQLPDGSVSFQASQQSHGENVAISTIRATRTSMIQYVELNPVRRRVKKHWWDASGTQRAVDSQWSSAAPLEDIGTSPVALDPIPPDGLDCGT